MKRRYVVKIETFIRGLNNLYGKMIFFWSLSTPVRSYFRFHKLTGILKIIVWLSKGVEVIIRIKRISRTLSVLAGIYEQKAHIVLHIEL